MTDRQFIVMVLDSGVWIHGVDSEPFRFGSVYDFLQILIANPQIDLETADFLVHAPTCRNCGSVKPTQSSCDCMDM